jgi:acyl carrier protein
MTDMSKLEIEVAHLIVDTVNLEDIEAADIVPGAPLFQEGLGLDSIDALEIALAISKNYGFQLKSDDSDNTQIFRSLQSLSRHIESHRTNR